MEKQGDETRDGPEGITVAEHDGIRANIGIQAFA